MADKITKSRPTKKLLGELDSSVSEKSLANKIITATFDISEGWKVNPNIYNQRWAPIADIPKMSTAIIKIKFST